MLTDSDWLTEIWADTVSAAAAETGLADFPEACPWSTNEVLELGTLPDEE